MAGNGTYILRLSGLDLHGPTDIALNHDTDGLHTRITTVQSQADNNTTMFNNHINSFAQYAKYQDEINSGVHVLKAENRILKGIVQKQNKQLVQLNEKIAMLTAKSMERNITISGITGDIKGENCKEKVINFLKNQVEIDAEHNEIMVAHRVGRKTANIPRIIVARLQPNLKERIFKNIKHLKGKTNEDGNAYYINKQLPEMLVERNKEVRDAIRAQKMKDQDLHPSDKSKIEVVNKVVYVDDKPVTKLLKQIMPYDLFPEKSEKEKMEKIKLVSSDPVGEQGSEFTGFALKTGQIQEIRRAYRKVVSLHPSADHVVAAFNTKSATGYQDDDEYGADRKLFTEIAKSLPQNVAVFVVRYHSGTHLGPKRFNYIMEAGKQAVHRLLSEKDHKK